MSEVRDGLARRARYKTAAVRTPLEFLADVCQSLVIYDDSGTLERWRGYLDTPGDPTRQGADMSYRRFQHGNKELKRQKERNAGCVPAYPEDENKFQ